MLEMGEHGRMSKVISVGYRDVPDQHVLEWRVYLHSSQLVSLVDPHAANVKMP